MGVWTEKAGGGKAGFSCSHAFFCTGDVSLAEPELHACLETKKINTDNPRRRHNSSHSHRKPSENDCTV